MSGIKVARLEVTVRAQVPPVIVMVATEIGLSAVGTGNTMVAVPPPRGEIKCTEPAELTVPENVTRVRNGTHGLAGFRTSENENVPEISEPVCRRFPVQSRPGCGRMPVAVELVWICQFPVRLGKVGGGVERGVLPQPEKRTAQRVKKADRSRLRGMLNAIGGGVGASRKYLA